MRPRSAAALAVSAALAVAPATASGASPPAVLDTSYPCYGSHESVLLLGEGFTPRGEVALSVSGRQLMTLHADLDGSFTVRMEAPETLFGTTRLRFTASDREQPALRDHATIRIADPAVVVTPVAGGPRQPRRIRAWGFFDAAAVYAHVKRRGARRARNIRLGTPTGPCGVLDVTRRLFSHAPRRGAYALQFDALPRYQPDIASSVRYTLLYGVP